MKAQSDSPAHTVGGACQPPFRRGGYETGTMWCCPTCKGLWYVNGPEWEFHSRPQNVPPPEPVSVSRTAIDRLAEALTSVPETWNLPMTDAARALLAEVRAQEPTP